MCHFYPKCVRKRTVSFGSGQVGAGRTLLDIICPNSYRQTWQIGLNMLKKGILQFGKTFVLHNYN